VAPNQWKRLAVGVTKLLKAPRAVQVMMFIRQRQSRQRAVEAGQWHHFVRRCSPPLMPVEFTANPASPTPWINAEVGRN